MEVDNATKKMTVTQDGQVVKQIPVSLGKPSTPSSSGTMVVIDKHADYTFDTRREIENGYVVDVKYAMRLTWGGEFIHAAPWSVKAQGNRNVSHGCVNMSTENAQWLFDQTQVGDPVTIKGTEVDLALGQRLDRLGRALGGVRQGQHPAERRDRGPAADRAADHLTVRLIGARTFVRCRTSRTRERLAP